MRPRCLADALVPDVEQLLPAALSLLHLVCDSVWLLGGFGDGGSKDRFKGDYLCCGKVLTHTHEIRTGEKNNRSGGR
jgi:hypothetical protein